MPKYHYTVDESVANMRLDKALTILSEGVFSRSQIKSLIENHHVRLEDATAKASQKVQLNQTIHVIEPEPETLDLTPVNLDLEFLYEDQDIAVVNKPSGLVVHPASTVKAPTLVHGLLYQMKDLQAIGDTIRPGIVHRIDKDTSGLLVVAKNEVALKALQKALKSHDIEREYVALVDGVIPHNIGKIDAPIGRDAKNRQKMNVVDQGRASVTHFQVLERFDAHTMIACQLETGRTHQIRVHMNYIGYPIVGDPKYGRRKTDISYGQYLHAKRLSLKHPITQQPLTFEAPLPKPFSDKLEALRHG